MNGRLPPVPATLASKILTDFYAGVEPMVLAAKYNRSTLEVYSVVAGCEPCAVHVCAYLLAQNHSPEKMAELLGVRLRTVTAALYNNRRNADPKERARPRKAARHASRFLSTTSSDSGRRLPRTRAD